MTIVRKPNFDKRGGLVVVIVQDAVSLEVLMQGYANETALLQTLETGLATFFSTSRSKIWVKGEESGNVMLVRDVLVDCDGDSLLYLSEPQGDKLACHTGTRSCFYRSLIPNEGREEIAPKAGAAEALETYVVPVNGNILSYPRTSHERATMIWNMATFQSRLLSRSLALTDESYTRTLLGKKAHGCAKKFGEEASEFVIALVSEDTNAVIRECADVVYMLSVALISRGIGFEAVASELRQREKKSGIEEKASRNPS